VQPCLNVSRRNFTSLEAAPGRKKEQEDLLSSCSAVFFFEVKSDGADR